MRNFLLVLLICLNVYFTTAQTQCTQTTCQNGGSCYLTSNGIAACICLPNFTGTTCGTSKEEGFSF